MGGSGSKGAAAGGGGGERASAAALSELQGMGFSRDQAAVALEATGGDVVQAAELLLSQQPPAAPPVRQAQPDRSDAIAARERERNEAALRMALEESMRDAPPPPALTSIPPPVAMSEEDMLAEAIRASLELESPTPRRAPVKEPVPEPALAATGADLADTLQQHATALQGHPLAVDTLVAVLQMILDNPSSSQYRRLRLSNRKFRATLAVRLHYAPLIAHCSNPHAAHTNAWRLKQVFDVSRVPPAASKSC